MDLMMASCAQRHRECVVRFAANPATTKPLAKMMSVFRFVSTTRRTTWLQPDQGKVP
jgi:hypothetical protein